MNARFNQYQTGAHRPTNDRIWFFFRKQDKRQLGPGGAIVHFASGSAIKGGKVMVCKKNEWSQMESRFKVNYSVWCQCLIVTHNNNTGETWVGGCVWVKNGNSNKCDADSISNYCCYWCCCHCSICHFRCLIIFNNFFSLPPVFFYFFFEIF